MSTLSEPLRRAALYRFLALSFMPPSAKHSDQIRGLIPEMDEELREAALRLVDQTHNGDIEGLYHQVIGAQKNVRCCESDFLQEAAGNKGAVLGDIAGFYRAFGFDADNELREVPDHIAVELSFLSFLAFKQAFALHCDDVARMDICIDAEDKFIREHLDRWFHRFSGSLVAATRDGYYCTLALFADAALGPLLSAAREKVANVYPRPTEPHLHDHGEDGAGCASCFPIHGCGQCPA